MDICLGLWSFKALAAAHELRSDEPLLDEVPEYEHVRCLDQLVSLLDRSQLDGCETRVGTKAPRFPG